MTDIQVVARQIANQYPEPEQEVAELRHEVVAKQISAPDAVRVAELLSQDSTGATLGDGAHGADTRGRVSSGRGSNVLSFLVAQAKAKEAHAAAKDPAEVGKLKSDPRWGALSRITNQRIPDWDNLGYVRAFDQASRIALDLAKSYGNDIQLRVLTSELFNLMPPSMRNDAPFGPWGKRMPASRLYNTFPSWLSDRFPDFDVRPGDLPKPGPAFALVQGSRAELSARLFYPGQPGLFFAKVEGEERLVQIKNIITKDGEKFAQCEAVPVTRWKMGHDFYDTHQVVKPSVKALVPLAELEKRVFGQSSENSYGLDFDDKDHRAMALAYADELKNSWLNLRGEHRTVFDWIERANERFSIDDIAAIQRGAQMAATMAIAKYTAHPRRIHFKIDAGQGWGQEAIKILKVNPMMESTGSQYTDQRTGSKNVGIQEFNWTERLLSQNEYESFVAGNANCYKSGEMRARLLNGLLRPLGIWPDGTAVSNSTHGAFFERVVTPAPGSDKLLCAVPDHTKMNERIFMNQAWIGMGLGESHGGRFSLRTGYGSETWDPAHDAESYEQWLAGF